MRIPLTGSQRSALRTDRHIAVRANAGSGKTAVLTLRYIWIVVHDNKDVKDSIASIVAITFTTKAAAEMQNRVHTRVNELIEDAEARESVGFEVSDTIALRRLHEMRTLISNVRIQTFHAFCNGILRTYAHVLGIDPESREIPESEVRKMRTDAVRAALGSFLEDQQTKESTLQLYEVLGLQTIEVALISFVMAREHAGTIDAWLSESTTDEIVARRGIRWKEIIQQAVFGYVATALEGIQAHNLEDSPQAQTWFEKLKQYRQMLLHAECTVESMQGILVDLEHLYNASNGESKKRPKAFPGVEALPTLPKHWIAVLLTFKSAWAPLEDVEASTAKTLYAIAEQAQDIFTREKRLRNGIDYADMIACTIRLLKDHPRIASDVQMSLAYVMVDEFQDTDPRQLDFIRLVIPELDNHRLPARTNLFIVGDPKQSIYGFRGADVQSFVKVEDLINSANRARLWEPGSVLLQESFRMAGGLVDAINRICRRIFVEPTEQTPFEVAYEDLIAGRVATPNATPGTIQKLSAEDGESSAMAVVAEHITQILNGAIEHISAEPQDIAVLVRTHEKAAEIAKQLLLRNVPTHTHGGRQFYSRPEVADIRNLLQWTADNADSQALVALLRSPMFRLDDSELTTIALSYGSGFTLDSLNALVAAGNATVAMNSAASLLNSFPKHIRSVSPARFVRDVLHATSWHSTLINDDRREQILANVEKLISIIENTFDKPGATLYDVVAEIQLREQDDEGDELYIAGSKAVQIMTFHAAKGLEFPIVILAGLSTRRQNRSGYFSSDGIGPTFALSSGNAPDAPSHVANQIVHNSIADAEQRRLLYVGLTRAQDYIVVSVDSKDLEVYFFDVPQTTVTVTEQQYTGKIAESEWIDVRAAISVPARLHEVTVTELVRYDSDAIIDGNASSTSNAMLIGTIVHEALSLCIADTTVSASEIGRIVADLGVVYEANEAVVHAAHIHVGKVFRSGVLPTFQGNAQTEVPHVGMLDGTVIHGRVDAIIEHENSVEIWDWKTNAVTSAEEMHNAAATYEIQMMAYAWLVMRNSSVAEAKTTLAFTALAQEGAVWTLAQNYTRSDLPRIEMRLQEAIEECYLTTMNGIVDANTPATMRA